MQKKYFNRQVFFEIICYILFAGLLLYLILSKNYLNYVTPKMKPYFYFMILVMLIWAVNSSFRLFVPQHKKRLAHCLVLLIPALLLVLPNSGVMASSLTSANFNSNTLLGAANNNFNTNDNNSQVIEDEPKQDDNITAIPDILPQASAKKLVVEDTEFYKWISEIFTNMYAYEGYEITITGFVFKDAETMNENEFVPARMLMTCCVADLMPCGIICEYDKASELKEDEWITVEGTLHIGQYMGEDEPQITVAKISPASKPKEEYVYP